MAPYARAGGRTRTCAPNLESWCSSQLSYPRLIASYMFIVRARVASLQRKFHDPAVDESPSGSARSAGQLLPLYRSPNKRGVESLSLFTAPQTLTKVPRAGIEPARAEARGILSPLCLPISPPRRGDQKLPSAGLPPEGRDRWIRYPANSYVAPTPIGVYGRAGRTASVPVTKRLDVHTPSGVKPTGPEGSTG